MNDRLARPVTILLLVVAALLAAAHVPFGRGLGDEGWYCRAAQLVAEGRVLYRDFFHAQMPVTALILAGPFRLAGPSIALGRAVATFVLVLDLVLLAACVRRDGGWAAAAAVALVGLNPYVLWIATKPVTTPFECLFVLLCMLALGRDEVTPGRALAASACAALAAGTRLSLAPLVPLVAAFCAWRTPDGGRARIFALCLACSAAVCALVAAPFWVASEGRMGFQVFTFHISDLRIQLPPEVKRAFRLDHMRESLRIFSGVLAFAAAAGALWIAGQEGRRFAPRPWEAFALVLAFALVPGHFLPNLSYPKYHVVSALGLVLFAAPVLARALASFAARTGKPAGALLATLALFPAAFLRWDLVRDDGLAPPEKVRRAARIIETLAGAEPALVLDAALAVEGRFRAMPGFEMSEFALAPHADPETARRQHLIDRARFLDLIASREARVLAMTREVIVLFRLFHGEELRELERAILDGYRVVETVPNYGEFRSDLLILARR